MFSCSSLIICSKNFSMKVIPLWPTSIYSSPQGLCALEPILRFRSEIRFSIFIFLIHISFHLEGYVYAILRRPLLLHSVNKLFPIKQIILYDKNFVVCIYLFPHCVVSQSKFTCSVSGLFRCLQCWIRIS
jgi:hypothetical protein